MSEDDRPTDTAGLVIHVATARLAQPVAFKGSEVHAVIDALLRR